MGSPESKTKGKAEGARRPLERVLRIHEMVNRGGYPNCSSIAREMEMNRKTIQRDINFMRDELDLPIAYSDSNHGYHYTKPVNDFPFLKTTAEDLVSLIMMRSALAPLKGSELESAVRNSFQRVLSTMQDQVSIPWTDLDQAFSVKSTGLTERDVLLFDRLARAVFDCREISFEYRKLKSDETMQRRLQPYHLTEVDGGWYLIGYDLLREAMRTFAVPRMRNVQVTEKRFVRSQKFKLEDHFAGSFGVWSGDSGNGKKLYDVCIRFRGFAARVVAERRWHPSQEITDLDGKGNEIEIRMSLTALEDIARWVMGYGSLAEAVSPPELREEVARELELAAKQY